jgi:hypothetical protein
MTSLIETEVSSIGLRLTQALYPGAAHMWGLATAHMWGVAAAHGSHMCGVAAHYHVSWLRIWVMMMAVVRHVKVLCYRKSTKKSIYKSRFPATINFRVPKLSKLPSERGCILQKKIIENRKTQLEKGSI